MATQSELDDPLYNLRLSIKTGHAPILTTSADPSAATDTVEELSQATHIAFNIDAHHKVFEITTPTRFTLEDKPVALRDVYFAWLNKDAAVADYLTAVQRLNEELPSGAGGDVQNLSFAQKVELIAWLSGETETSDSIAPLDGTAATAAAENASNIASGKTGGVPMDKGGKDSKMVDARLLQIYDGERSMGDHNTILRGSKPTDFSSYRKTAATFLRRGNAIPAALPSHANPLVANMNKKDNRRRLEPIILLSPSASSLLRMANIKSFLDDGVYRPYTSSDTSANMLYLNRILPSIDPSRPMRFILVDSTANFKPPYWSRVVAIFTTGQTWQFKSYKYTNPSELFNQYPGFYVGWRGEEVPENVQNWGRGMLALKIDKPLSDNKQGRWRDREVVEQIWQNIEEHMRKGGWGRDGPGVPTTR
ncbi:RNA polymerase II accessory factor [Amniculicola lignicola CBS 123094]|uniref:RNA polymerase II accessory factor n=1 Tax=Amniculicola lignicola CBS 123094 TaxID=1392246 RepID=A0A6A5W166_9PLEO|nr:RNA polymerase II accessory factor [Amniculicola lignicola CBS 123094]